MPPGGGATVSGTTAVSASASDNVGVVGVQFLLDGAALGAEDTTSPYSVSWSTTNSSNGSHTLTATARDAAGNRTTSAGVTVTVSNAPPPDTTPPTVRSEERRVGKEWTDRRARAACDKSRGTRKDTRVITCA